MTQVNSMLSQQNQNWSGPEEGSSKWFWLAGFAVLLLGIYWFTYC